MKTLAFLGHPSEDRYCFNWCIDGQELGYQTKMNDISGLTRNDIIIVDKKTELDLTTSSAKKILFFPDVIRTEELSSPYLNERTDLLAYMADFVDIIVMPPNKEVMAYARKITGKEVYPFTFGVYRQYFSYFPAKFPKKDIQLGYCWSPFGNRRDDLAKSLRAKRISAFGKDMFVALSKCSFALNGHFTLLLNNEQRLTEIPLACTIPVSEPLSSPELLSDLYWLPVEEYPKKFSRKEYLEIIKNNAQAVRHKYNSLESLRMILSYL